MEQILFSVCIWTIWNKYCINILACDWSLRSEFCFPVLFYFLYPEGHNPIFLRRNSLHTFRSHTSVLDCCYDLRPKRGNIIAGDVDPSYSPPEEISGEGTTAIPRWSRKSEIKECHNWLKNNWQTIDRLFQNEQCSL